MLQLYHDIKNPLFKVRDVYDIQQKIREDNLKGFLLVQALLKELIISDE